MHGQTHIKFICLKFNPIPAYGYKADKVS